MESFINKYSSDCNFHVRVISNVISDDMIDIDIGSNTFNKIRENLLNDQIKEVNYKQTKYYYHDIHMITKNNNSSYIKTNIIDKTLHNNKLLILNYKDEQVSSDLFSGINTYPEILTETIYSYIINNINIQLVKSQNIKNDINYNCNIYLNSNVNYEQLYKLLNTYVNDT